MADTQNAENTINLADYWAVHAEFEGRPWLRDWAKTEAEAQAKMEEHKKNDTDAASTEYWVLQMTQDEVVSFQDAGVIPSDG